MQKLGYLAVLGVCLLTGCTRHYVITYNNGTQIMTNGKPKAEGNSYVFKDSFGREIRVPVTRVKEVAPASMVKTREPYKPKTQ